MAEAVPVVDVMSGNSNSMLEGLALANGGCGFGGGNGFGAQIRTNFSITLKYDGKNKKWIKIGEILFK